MQGRNGDADVENGLADTVGEGEGGTNGESRISIYTGPCVKWRSVLGLFRNGKEGRT